MTDHELLTLGLFVGGIILALVLGQIRMRRSDNAARSDALKVRKTVSIDALFKMPRGQAVAITTTLDMDQKLRCAVVWLWRDDHGAVSVRKSYYCADTGEYLGEAA